MLPLLIGLGVAGAAGIGSAIAGHRGASKAAKAQERSAREAMDLQREIYGQQRADQAPWLQAGQASLADLLRQMQGGAFSNNVNPQSLAGDPGYQFRLAEGQKALERSAAARGGLNSGGTMRSLARYSQGVASDEYQNAWNRNRMSNMDSFGRLAQLAGMGQGAAQSLGGFGSQYAGQMGNLYGAVGNAQSAGHIGRANAVSGGLQTLGNLAQIGGMNAGGFGGGYGGGGFGGQGIPTQQAVAPLNPYQGPNRIGGY